MYFKLFPIRLLVTLAVFSISGSTLQAQEKPLLLKNATIIDGDASVQPYRGSVLLLKGTIKAIYRNDKKLPRVSDQIDCTGKYITPGLTDSHVHLATDSRTAPDVLRRHTDSICANLVKHGILTVRDMAGDSRQLQAVLSSEKQGMPGPDIFYAAQFAGPEYFKLLSRGSKAEGLGTTPWYRAISSVADVKPAVAAAKSVGVTGIKIYDSLTREIIEEITKQAHKAGLQAWSHASVFPTKPLYVAQAAVNTMSHANDIVFQQLPDNQFTISKAWQAIYKGLLPDSSKIFTVLKEMKKHDIILDATLYSAFNNKLKCAPIIAKWAFDIGLRISAGTDWIYPTQEETQPLQEELLRLQESCGMTALQTIQACVKTGPEAIGLSDRGLIRKGYKAHLLILKTNPLTDLRSLFSPEKVFKSGNLIEIK